MITIERIDNYWVEVITAPESDHDDVRAFLRNLSIGVAVVCKTLSLDFWLNGQTLLLLSPSIYCPNRKVLYKTADLYVPLSKLATELIWVVGDAEKVSTASYSRLGSLAFFQLPERQ